MKEKPLPSFVTKFAKLRNNLLGGGGDGGKQGIFKEITLWPVVKPALRVSLT